MLPGYPKSSADASPGGFVIFNAAICNAVHLCPANCSNCSHAEAKRDLDDRRDTLEKQDRWIFVLRHAAFCCPGCGFFGGTTRKGPVLLHIARHYFGKLPEFLLSAANRS
jgi:hypothetical protein